MVSYAFGFKAFLELAMGLVEGIDLSTVVQATQGFCVLFVMWLFSQLMGCLEDTQGDVQDVRNATAWLKDELDDRDLTNDIRMKDVERRIASLESKIRPSATPQKSQKPKSKPKLKIA